MPTTQEQKDSSAAKSTLLCCAGILFMVLGLLGGLTDSIGPIEFSAKVPWNYRFGLCMFCALVCLSMSGWLKKEHLAAIAAVMPTITFGARGVPIATSAKVADPVEGAKDV